MQQILSYDKQLFRLVNSEWSNVFFDFLMPWLRNSNLWHPMYLFLLLYMIINYKTTGWWWVIFAAGTPILTDFVSSTLVKPNIWRLRPCNNIDYASWINVLVGYRPQSSSFTSSHAANHFGMAAFFYITLHKKWHGWATVFFLWAGAISFAQVYVGVHYPLDIIAGALIGILIGYLSGRSFNRNYALT